MNEVTEVAPQTGNVNPQMGEAHKQMIAQRLSNHNDPLTLELARLTHPNLHSLTSSSGFRSSKDTNLKGSEIGFTWQGIDNNAQVCEGKSDIATKGCSGFGSLNQLAIFWLSDLLSQAELETPAGQALTAIAGSSSRHGVTESPMLPGALMSGVNYKKYGKFLQTWMGTNLNRFIEKGLNTLPGQTGEKILLLGMRGAGKKGEDIFVAVDSGRLASLILKESIHLHGTTPYLPVLLEDKTLKMSSVMELKRMGGVSNGLGANQLQLIVRTKGLLKKILEGYQDKNGLQGLVCVEDPSVESRNIEKMNPNYVEEESTEPESTTEVRNLWSKIERFATRLEVSPTHKKKMK